MLAVTNRSRFPCCLLRWVELCCVWEARASRVASAPQVFQIVLTTA